MSGTVDGGLFRETIRGGGTVQRIEARLLGTSLLWRIAEADGDEYAFQRVADPAQVSDTAAADPFRGTWVGEGERLVLSGSAGTYSGTLTVAGETWPILGRAKGSVLTCTVAGRGEAGRLTATVSGRLLMLSGQAASARLERVQPDSSSDR